LDPIICTVVLKVHLLPSLPNWEQGSASGSEALLPLVDQDSLGAVLTYLINTLYK